MIDCYIRKKPNSNAEIIYIGEAEHPEAARWKIDLALLYCPFTLIWKDEKLVTKIGNVMMGYYEEKPKATP